VEDTEVVVLMWLGHRICHY